MRWPHRKPRRMRAVKGSFGTITTIEGARQSSAAMSRAAVAAKYAAQPESSIVPGWVAAIEWLVEYGRDRPTALLVDDMRTRYPLTGGECGECADRRAKAARPPADDAGEVAALIGAIDAHHAALSEDVLLEAIVQEMLATDGLTETSSGGLYSVHEDDLEVLAKAALCTVRAADDAAEVEGAYNEMSYRLGEARFEADRLRAEVKRLREALERPEATRAAYDEVCDERAQALRAATSLLETLAERDETIDRLRVTLGKAAKLHADDDEGWCVSCSTGAPCQTARLLAADPVSLADVREKS